MAEIVPIDKVRQAVSDATAVPPAPEGDHDGDRRGRPPHGLPDACPVTPLGVHGMTCVYLDQQQQLIELAARDHSRNNIKKLFGTEAYLCDELWPAFDKDGEKKANSYKPDHAADALMIAAARKGVIDLFDKVRGPGAWTGDDGELILHCGDAVLVGSPDPARAPKWRPPGEVGRHVYPSAAPKPRPAKQAAIAGREGPAQDLLEIVKTWNWLRPEVDPYLMLGWIGAAMIGGALTWRPAAWITGDRHTGKSTLHELMRMLFDEGGLISLSDATQAGITQHVKHASLPVALDELEPTDKGQREQAVIQLARLAASGGQMARGGADHSGHSFTIRYCLLFSSILVPALTPQDRSRLAILELLKLEGVHPPKLERKKLRQLGALLRRRMVDQWHRFPTVLAQYRMALAEAGHSGRGADQFGTLLACQEVLLHGGDEVDSDTLGLWQERLKASALAERGDDMADHELCLNHILSSLIDPWRAGAKHTVAQHIRMALTAPGASEHDQENKALELSGLKVGLQPSPSSMLPGVWYLYVSNSHQGLAALFRDTHWASAPGKSAVWVQALRRVSFAMPGPDSVPTMRFGGVSTRYTMIPLSEVPSFEDLLK